MFQKLLKQASEAYFRVRTKQSAKALTKNIFRLQYCENYRLLYAPEKTFSGFCLGD